MKGNKTMELCSPLTGTVVMLSEVADEAFATGILGEGVAVTPTEGVLCAPADGQIEQLFDSHHAVTLKTDGGAELLLHIGIDTVALKGKHFEALIEAGAHVKRGTPLLRFDIAGIRAAGYDVTTPMIVSNSDDYVLSVVAKGAITVSAPLLRLEQKRK